MSAAVCFDIEEVMLFSLIPRFSYDGSIGIHCKLAAAGAIANHMGISLHMITNFEAAYHILQFFIGHFDLTSLF